MTDFYRQPRQLPPGPGQFDGSFDRQAAGSVSLGHFFGVLRRHKRLVLLLTIFGALGGAYLAYRSAVTYQATAVLRVAGERRALTGEARTGAQSYR